jgi:ech hydrogenase subunit A
VETLLLEKVLLAVLIAAPVLFGLLAWLSPVSALRSAFVVLGAAITCATGIMAAVHGSFSLSLPRWGDYLSYGLELAIIAAIFGIAVKLKDWRIGLLAIAQIVMALLEKLLPHTPKPAAATFLVDPLALILILVISVVGSVIVLYAVGYMRKHEEHAPETAAPTGRFFLFLVGFLGAMNGLVMANDLRWLSIFWEITTVCSFMLIGHDGTEEARANARRALLINMFGGAAMILGGLICSVQGNGNALSHMMGAQAMAPIALLCLAAFTKSAQMPFQSWLLGAMVAPTPVSALLHSATMVKAGSYLVLRLAPAYQGTKLSYVIAIAGAFTFAATSALAISQSNAKKVLAYSTIANLGLIVACAGINTPLAYSAAVLILAFHAVSKGLLFLCVGAIEQKIGSRDIEDMGGIMYRMPLTTLIALLGMVAMLAPPFGMLLSKWMAIEAAIFSPLVLFLIVIGSALTVLFWAKWIGRIQTVSYHERYEVERLPGTVFAALFILGAGVILTGLLAFPLIPEMEPLVRHAYVSVLLPEASFKALRAAGGFVAWPIFLFAGLGLLAAFLSVRRFTPAQIRAPFLCGENVGGTDVSYSFRSLMDKPDTAWSKSLYLKPVFSEDKITFWANLVACMVILTMFGLIGAL